MHSHRLADLIDDRPQDGVFRVNRAMFADPALFALEMEHVFEGGWVFLGISSQAERPHDYFTTTIGRVPVFVSRDKAGELGCFVNSCPHKGARIANLPSGNARLHVCPYHSWTFDSAGQNKAVKWEKAGCYAQGFAGDKHDLNRIAKFGEYRGFLFGSLNPASPPLEEHLGEARRMLDLLADQGESGLELVPGRVRFTYGANWKMQLENCSDQYHFTSTHPSYIRLLEIRASEAAAGTVQSTIGDATFWGEGDDQVVSGSFSFEHGHVVTWGKMDVSPSLPLYSQAEELARRHGTVRRDWMFNMRNLTIFPNMQLAENASSQLRVIRPIRHDLTEMDTWCIAPKDEAAEARRLRIRQYEDFFNPSGMATPDDTAIYEECQFGMTAQNKPWLQGHARGLAGTSDGGNEFSDMLDMKPARSIAGSSRLADETLFQSYYREWSARMAGALA